MSSGSTEVTLIWRDNLLAGTPQRRTVAHGATVAELVNDLPLRPRLRPYVVASIGDRQVPRHLWPRVRPRPGTTLLALPVPQGGGAGGSSKTLRTAAMLGLLAAAAASGQLAAAAAGGGLLGAAAGGAVSAAVGISGAYIPVIHIGRRPPA